MNRNYWCVSAAMTLALGAGCASEEPEDASKGVMPGGGMGGAAPGGPGGTMAQPSGGMGPMSTAATGASGMAGVPSMAGGGAMAGMSGAMAGMSGAMAGMGGATPAGMGGDMPEPDAGMMTPDSGAPPMMGMGECCDDGDCYCHGDPPSAPTSREGPFMTDSYDIPSAGCVFYPTNAEPPFAAVAVSDGFLGTGGCGFSQTGEWGPLYASWGIVAMIIHTGSGDQPQQRGTKLTAGIAAFKAENEKSGSPLFGKLGGRYGTSGFSMGGGGTTFAAKNDPTLKSNVSIMAWTPTTGLTVPSLFIFGSSDTLAGTMGMTSYRSIADTVPKMAVTVSSGHAGQPSSGAGKSGEAGLAFQKVFLEGDERWRPVLLMVKATESTVK